MLDYRGYNVTKVADVFVAKKKGEKLITDADRIGLFRAIDNHLDYTDNLLKGFEAVDRYLTAA